MKKLMTLALTLLIMMALASCGGPAPTPEPAEQAPAVETAPPEAAAPATEMPPSQAAAPAKEDKFTGENQFGYRTTVGSGDAEFTLIVLKGTPYEMGKRFGELTKDEAKTLIERFIGGCQAEDAERYSDANLDDAWEKVSPYTDERFKEEMRGLADGTGIPFDLIKRAHMLPVLANYSCSSIAAWGEATRNGDLYQTRNLDWSMELRAHDVACIVVYIPNEGIPHVSPTFAGYIGCNTGMNAKGIALAEMGDSPGKEYPFDINGEHFTTLFRDVLYDANNLKEAVDLFKGSKRIKKYHYVVGDGQGKQAVKILAHAPNLVIWTDNDPTDEKAPNILEDVVYQDEERGAFEPLKQSYGQIDENIMIDIAKAIPIKGGNVLDVVYNNTTLEFWISYAKDDVEAYKRPFVHVNLNDYIQ